MWGPPMTLDITDQKADARALQTGLDLGGLRAATAVRIQNWQLG